MGAGSWEQLTLFDVEAPALPRPCDHDERVAAGRGARRLLAVILRQALYDQAMAAAGRSFDRRLWPWNGEWTPQEELDAFWQSDWCANVCSWLDMDVDTVLEFIRGVRDGTQYVETDRRRTVSTGSPGS